MNGLPARISGQRLQNPTWDRLLTPSNPVQAFDQNPAWESGELRSKFNEFVAGSLFQSMLQAMRKTVGKNPIIDGGRAEEIFRGQLDQILAQRMAERSGASFSDKLYEQFIRQQDQHHGQAPTHGSTNLDKPGDPATPGRLADHTF
jgi:hypothetical protein